MRHRPSQTIATGGAIPRGADAVVMIEHTELIETPDGPAIEVRRAAAPGQFVSFAGSDMARGETVLRRGQPLEFNERAASNKLLGKHVPIMMNLHGGKASARYWTCDFTAEYVRINASYRT